MALGIKENNEPLTTKMYKGFGSALNAADSSELSGKSWENPEWWLDDILGVERIYPKQIEIIKAVKDNPQVSVCGSNSTGKDWMAGRIALWWVYCHEQAKVLITGPTHRQVYDIVWQEASEAYKSSTEPLGGNLYETSRLRYGESRFVLGFATDKPYNLQGFHSPNLLVIITEAHGMKQKDIDAIMKLNPRRLLLTGNPISESGEFFESHHGKTHLWHTININAYDTPNLIEGREVIPGLITLENIERHRQNWGEDNPLYRMTVLNEWCEGMGDLVVVPISWVRQAEQNELEPGDTEVVACDVARFGRDSTVVVSRKGSVARIIWRIQGQDTMKTAGFLKDYHDKHRYAHIVVDSVGMGSGPVDRLREQGVGVFAFNGGEAADDSGRFFNRNAEVYWRMREAIELGFDIEQDANLRGQLSSRKYTIQSDKRIKLESKDDMRKEGRQSPDEADALAMTFVYDWMRDVELEGDQPFGSGMQSPFNIDKIDDDDERIGKMESGGMFGGSSKSRFMR